MSKSSMSQKLKCLEVWRKMMGLGIPKKQTNEDTDSDLHRQLKWANRR